MEKLKKFEYSMDSCNHCGQCKWILPPKMSGWDFAEICPIHRYHRFDAYSGQGLLNISKEVLTGRLKIGEGLENVLYSCTVCGACDVNCKNVRDIEVLETIQSLREVCAREGSVPESVKTLCTNIEEKGNIFGFDGKKRFDFLPADFQDDVESENLLFLGCSVYTHPEIALAAIKLLRAGGVSFRIFRDESCCGAAVWRSGYADKAEKIIKANVEKLRERGIKRIISPCAECFGAFRAVYPRFADMDAEVLHMSQVVAALTEEGKLRFAPLAEPVKLTYHDPCMLGRLSEPWQVWEGEIKSFGRHVPEKKWRRGFEGIYHEPRAALKAVEGVELCEMPRNYENALCCGYASRETDPEMSADTAAERMREAASVGAETLVSCCPFCIDALGKEGKAIDLCVFLAQRLEEGGAK